MSMSERSEKLFAAIGDVRDDLIDEAAEDRNLKRKAASWLRWGGIAAALLLTAGLGLHLLPGLGGGGASAPASQSGGSGSDAGTEFMSYAGPVFPLTLAEENGAITAERDLTLDFAPWAPEWISNEDQLEEARAAGATEADLAEYAADLERWYPEGGYYEKGTGLLVTDGYVLTNSSAEDQTVELLYPYVSTLRDYRADQPTLTVDGETRSPEVLAGGYTGGFRGAGGENDGRLNLDQPTSWTDYQAVLADGSYLAAALGEYSDLSGVPVTLYTFTDPWGPGESEENPNPSIRVMYDADLDRTTVLSLNFHMGWVNEDGLRQGLGFSIPETWQKNHGQPYYFIVIGDDIENIDVQGYNTGGWDTDVTVEAGVTMTREETDLDTALRLAARGMYTEELRFGSAIDADFELYYGLLCGYLLTYGVLSDDPAERYDGGWLDTLDFDIVDRVFYLKQEVTVPAGGSVTVTAALRKEASFDYQCAGTENQGISGYDAVTTLGSDLTFTAQRAKLEDRGQIEIVRENFGFDLETGVTEVKLDLNTEHYYLEVRRK